MWPRRDGELFQLPRIAGGPFGEEPEPWWRSKPGGAPKQYTRPLAVVSGLIALANMGAHGTAKLLILPFAVGAPVALVDWWWRDRTRRDAEQVLPEGRLGARR